MRSYNIDKEAFLPIQSVLKADGSEFTIIGDEVAIPVVWSDKDNEYIPDSDGKVYLKLTDYLSQLRERKGDIEEASKKEEINIDWLDADETSQNSIKHKPTKLSEFINDEKFLNKETILKDTDILTVEKANNLYLRKSIECLGLHTNIRFIDSLDTLEMLDELVDVEVGDVYYIKSLKKNFIAVQNGWSEFAGLVDIAQLKEEIKREILNEMNKN